MHRTIRAAVVVLAVLVTGFMSAGAAGPAGAAVSPQVVGGFTAGGGQYLLQDSFTTRFGFVAVAFGEGNAAGLFHQSVVLDGERVEFSGAVTCVTFDPINHRAWIGGVVTKNRSTHPDFITAIHQPGRDVWFRVLDATDSGEADRSTFLGFEGAAGVSTSAEYCALQLWPPDNARTWPVVVGGIVTLA